MTAPFDFQALVERTRPRRPRPAPAPVLLDRPSYRCRPCFFADSCPEARVLEHIRCPLLPRPPGMSKP